MVVTIKKLWICFRQTIVFHLNFFFQIKISDLSFKKKVHNCMLLKKINIVL